MKHFAALVHAQTRRRTLEVWLWNPKGSGPHRWYNGVGKRRKIHARRDVKGTEKKKKSTEMYGDSYSFI